MAYGVWGHLRSNNLESRTGGHSDVKTFAQLSVNWNLFLKDHSITVQKINRLIESKIFLLIIVLKRILLASKMFMYIYKKV